MTKLDGSFLLVNNAVRRSSDQALEKRTWRTSRERPIRPSFSSEIDAPQTGQLGLCPPPSDNENQTISYPRMQQNKTCPQRIHVYVNHIDHYKSCTITRPIQTTTRSTRKEKHQSLRHYYYKFLTTFYAFKSFFKIINAEWRRGRKDLWCANGTSINSIHKKFI
jgi:hypothetical protein